LVLVTCSCEEVVVTNRTFCWIQKHYYVSTLQFRLCAVCRQTTGAGEYAMLLWLDW